MLRARLQSLPYELVSLISECFGVDDRQKELGRKVFHNILMLPSLCAIRRLSGDFRIRGAIDYSKPALFSFEGSANDDPTFYLIEKILDVSNNRSVTTRYHGEHNDYTAVSYRITDDAPVHADFFNTDFYDEYGVSRTTLRRVYTVMCRHSLARSDTFIAAVFLDGFSCDPLEFAVIQTAQIL
jgi:hypothetical protein